MRLPIKTVSLLASVLIIILSTSIATATVSPNLQIASYGEIVYPLPEPPTEYWFLDAFYSGRSERIQGNYLYARTASFANITSSGDLIRIGNVNPNRPLYGGTNWADIDEEWPNILQRGRILVLGLWVNNFEEQTVTSVTNFMTKLQQRAENLNTYVIWLPCWEFNQEHNVDVPYADFWGWGTTRENKWYIESSQFNQKMKIFREVRDNINADRVLLAVQVDSLVRYNWDNWEGNRGGIEVIEPYAEGANYADIIGCSMYISDGSIDRGLYDSDFIALCFERMHQIRDYIDATQSKPFFVFEYNSMASSGMVSSDANEFFIENSYALVEEHSSWGLRCLSWYCPFSNSTMYDVCNYWAGVYDGWTPP